MQVCDDEWHHYSLSMQYPELTLTVDGRPVSVEPQMHEVIDDWPLHSAPDLSTRLSVGGCWQGESITWGGGGHSILEVPSLFVPLAQGA